jgi:hypothetical protein
MPAHRVPHLAEADHADAANGCCGHASNSIPVKIPMRACIAHAAKTD